MDENLKETFPASDPPAWTLGTDHRPDAEARTGRRSFKAKLTGEVGFPTRPEASPLKPTFM